MRKRNGLIDPFNLPRAKHVRIVQKLWDSIVDEETDETFKLSPSLQLELDRRLRNYRKNPSSAVPWEVAKKRVVKQMKKTS